MLIFFIAGLLYLLRFERVDNLGAYSIPSETGLLIPLFTTTMCYRVIALYNERVSVGSCFHAFSVWSAVRPSRFWAGVVNRLRWTSNAIA